jgi:hypothetical protein
MLTVVGMTKKMKACAFSRLLLNNFHASLDKKNLMACSQWHSTSVGSDRQGPRLHRCDV